MWRQNNDDGVYITELRNPQQNLPEYKTYYLNNEDQPSNPEKNDSTFCRKDDNRNSFTERNSKSKQRRSRYDENNYALAYDDSDDEHSRISLKENKRRCFDSCCATKLKCLICTVITIIGSLIIGVAIVALLVRLDLISSPVTKESEIVSTTTIKTPNKEITISTANPTSRNWTHWENWTKCTDECGDGQRIRSRSCKIRDSSFGCVGKDYEIEGCNNKPCSNGTCCSAITVEMDNIAFKYQGSHRGDYILNEGLANGYGHVVFQSKLNANKYLFRLGPWLFGPNITRYVTSGLYHKDCKEECPNNCPQSWRFWKKDDGVDEFVVNKKIKVSCEHRICCLNLKISSDAQFAKQECPECFGNYRYFAKDEHGALIWRLLSSKHQRYIVRDHKKSIWKIFDHFDKVDEDHYPYLSRYFTDLHFCPEYAQQGYWEYHNNTSGDFQVDHNIKISCADENSGRFQIPNSHQRRYESNFVDGQIYDSSIQDKNENSIPT